MEETFDEENDNIIKTDKKPDDIGDGSTIQNTTFENLEKTLPSEIPDAKHETANDHNERVKIQEQSPAIGKKHASKKYDQILGNYQIKLVLL